MAYSIQQLQPAVLAAFEGAPKLESVTGPHTLIRIGGPASQEPGHWWFQERLFWDVLDEVTISGADSSLQTYLLKTMLRQELAVSHDWNRFVRFYRLSLPPGARVAAWQGRARLQPEYSLQHRLTAQRSSRLRLLFGGGYQYFIPEVPAALVRGPFPLRVAGSGHA